ncbi:MAG: hypothetical protein AAFS02_02100 [Pseudomonadota bacterium]
MNETNAKRLSRTLTGPTAFAIVDQGLYTVANFLAGLTILWQAGLEAFGHYALVISLSSAAKGVASGLIIEPVAVLGSGPHGDGIKSGALLIGITAVLSSSLVLLLMAGTDAYTLAGCALAIFLGQLGVHLLRQVAYVDGTMARAVGLSGTYLLLIVAGSVASVVTTTVGVRSATVVLALSGIAATLLWLRRPHVALAESLTAWKTTGHYSRTAVVSNVLGAFALQLVYWVGGVLGQVQVVGLLKLFEQMTAPVYQIVIAISQIRLVELSALFSRAGFSGIRRRIRIEAMRYFWLGATGAVVFVIAVLLVGARPGYLSQSQWYGFVFVFSVVPVVQAVSASLIVAAKAVGKPVLTGAAYVAMAASIGTAVALTQWLGEPRLLFAYVLGWLAFTGSLTYLVLRLVAGGSAEPRAASTENQR